MIKNSYVNKHSSLSLNLEKVKSKVLKQWVTLLAVKSFKGLPQNIVIVLDFNVECNDCSFPGLTLYYGDNFHRF
jgi:hypothetical protein